MEDLNLQIEPDEVQAEVPAIEPEIEKIKIGEEEYSLDEAQALLKLGKLGKELETQWDTDISKVYPKFTQATKRVKELEESNAQYEAEKNAVPVDKQVAYEEARRQAKEIGILTKDDIDEVVSRIVEQKTEERKQVESVLQEANDLEKELNGSDGRPKFEKEKTIQYMVDTGVRDMRIAYELSNRDALDTWRLNKLQETKSKGIVTQPGGGAKKPEEPRITKDNLNEMVREALNVEG
jgi:hypothetical protein